MAVSSAERARDFRDFDMKKYYHDERLPYSRPIGSVACALAGWEDRRAVLRTREREWT